MPPSVLLAEYLLPRSAISLGRFVTNVDEPNQDYHDPATDLAAYTTEKLQSEYDEARTSQNRRSFASELTGILSASFSKRGGSSVHITSSSVKTYYLNNVGEWFKHAVQSEKTRKWVERTIDEGEDMYIVTSFRTLLDARIKERAQGERGASGKFVSPVSATLAALGRVLPISDLTDPNIKASNNSMEGETREFVAKGEQVCAVQYRKIRHSWFSSKDTEKMKLARNPKWERYDRPRLFHGEIPDMVEVELEDATSFGTDRDTHVTKDGEIFVGALDEEPEQ